MKKIIFVIAILLCATFCLTSCELVPTVTDVSYDTINQMINADYSELKIEINAKPTGESDGIVSEIICRNVNETSKLITYSIQQYATIDIDGDTITMPDNKIVTKTGYAMVNNGAVTSNSGDKVDFDFSAIDKINLVFSADNFADAKFIDTVFTADVTNVKAFWGKDVQGVTNAKVSVNVTDWVITLSGTANGSDVTVVYTITK